MFAGLLSFAPARPDRWVDPDAWQRALAPFRKPDLHGHWQSAGASLVEHRVFNSAENRDELVPLRSPESGTALAFWGRLDNRPALGAALGLGEDALSRTTDAALVFEAWRRWGDRVPEHLLGDFALAVVDSLQKQVFLARDPLGVKPLYYVLNGSVLAFATTVAALRAMNGLTITPDADWMARHLLRLSMSDRQTAYREVVKLPPGHCLTVGEDGREELRRFHVWRDDPPAARTRESRWVEDYRAVLKEAIRCRMASDFPLATENSGGLDSATITAYLALLLGEPGDRLYSLGFAQAEREPAYILETSRERHIVHNYLVTAYSGIDETEVRLDRALRVLGYPEEHGNGSFHTPFYRECELRGIRTLFSGFGGDEVATNAGDHLRWELLDSGNYRGLWDILPGNVVTRLLRLAKAATVGRKNPAYNQGFLEAWKARWSRQFLRPEVVLRLDLENTYLSTARHDAPFRRINDFILKCLLPIPDVATRLENCTLLAASYGVEYRWPLWDVRVVQQYLSTPSIEKVGPDGVGRYLHRRAVDGVVPHRVNWKPAKDMGKVLEREGLGLRSVADRAERLDAGLHPALDALVDRPKLREQIALVQRQGHVDDGFAVSFRLGVNALASLNHWLNDGRAG